MELSDKVVVITGGSGGIGRAMATAFLAEGAKEVTIADLNHEQVHAAATELGCEAAACDVTDEAAIAQLVEGVIRRSGRIDLFCSNAGAGGEVVLTDAANDVWQKQWELHVMSHVYAARAVLPSMLERGEGYLLNTASAAGLLAALGSGPYSVTKTAAVKLAEFLSITHGDEGIKVSVLCPQGVNTAMAPVAWRWSNRRDYRAEQLAQTVVETLERSASSTATSRGRRVCRRDNVDRWLYGRRSDAQRSRKPILDRSL